eukprot:CAMPEP_0206139762 /NCGR_PEP_ID=MMETSP1473-20131121/7160_1 /ASSEMBLY_ACC=CAM_ASM_001109 /TAXON_ID=1461547 /ORGANISM="Stichococcus sp, Strain RCC1054" /LENGTH=527 /DNA_ID=CAMNT_0053533659 /DNA_START=507 /DNA_END=2090 /DNA_ORIENTATION=+
MPPSPSSEAGGSAASEPGTPPCEEAHMELYRRRSMPDLSDCSSSDSDCECDSHDGREFPLPSLESTAEASHGRADDTSVSPSATPAQAQLAALKAAAARAQARAAGAPRRPPSLPFSPLTAGSSETSSAKAGIKGDSVTVPHEETALLQHGPARTSGCHALPSDNSVAAASAPAPAATWVQQPTPEMEGLGEAAVAAAATLGLTLQPLLWMNCKSHWMMFSATAVAQPEHQQLELADCSVSSGASLVASRDSAAASGDAATPVDTVADKGEWDDEEEALPELTPDIARLLPQKPVGVAPDLDSMGKATNAALEHLRGELRHSQAQYATIVRALHRKVQECESLQGVVRELTAGRARSSSARLALQERCGALLTDVARLGRIAELARQGQLESVAASEAATTARLQAEGDSAAANHRADEAEAETRRLHAANIALRARVAALERRCSSSGCGITGCGSPPLAGAGPPRPTSAPLPPTFAGAPAGASGGYAAPKSPSRAPLLGAAVNVPCGRSRGRWLGAGPSQVALSC